ncbi:hypothetical protein C482_05601 [Natrialba chahannaoensis JCM 10990]|uniref:Uncharacterized protein n=1 Tax=Natrialba chahannaoensis JCM 10990 TaxID=1227492 RepID=M0AVS0_9EURY|nr:hypothetical protein [Natrialba chahannaoensis]ELZ02048.1 hypothetical protein C482_05601 [Natrialba chahannaoensis JCM 10990]
MIERYKNQYDRKITYEPRSDGRVEKTEYEWSSADRWRFVGSETLEDVDLEAVTGATNSQTGP